MIYTVVCKVFHMSQPDSSMKAEKFVSFRYSVCYNLLCAHKLELRNYKLRRGGRLINDLRHLGLRTACVARGETSRGTTHLDPCTHAGQGGARDPRTTHAVPDNSASVVSRDLVI
jgi:hypothetical protein